MSREFGPVLFTLVGTLLLASGCGAVPASPDSMPTQVEGISVQAELNSATGSVTLPLDRFVTSRSEADYLMVANTVAASICAAEQGLEYQVYPTFPDSVQAIYAQEHYFGPWTVEQAERWGAVEPATLNDLIANGILVTETSATRPFLPPEAGEKAIDDVTDEEFKIVEECFSTSDQQFNQAMIRNGGWNLEYEPLEFNYKRNKQAVALVGELGQCFSDNGMRAETRDDAPWYPQGTRADRIDEEQILLALKAVECKDAINFTQRMADIEAQEQVAVIEKYSAEMVAKENQIDEAVSAAKQLITENPNRLMEQNPDHKP
ncbi:hypothetical protein V5R04_06895 [Jonesiaceae bacterium BS-20]|uniref:Uncharacterized protein n=1 Tax=Jonesiaceae bacterium BS-20 TaxID=3120821 RepID=A0AAU7DZ00_9MICO